VSLLLDVDTLVELRTAELLCAFGCVCQRTIAHARARLYARLVCRSQSALSFTRLLLGLELCASVCAYATTQHDAYLILSYTLLSFALQSFARLAIDAILLLRTTCDRTPRATRTHMCHPHLALAFGLVGLLGTFAVHAFAISTLARLSVGAISLLALHSLPIARVTITRVAVSGLAF
jgi:hypothetical protein